ncbi:MAG: hypothetical protein MZU95_13190 [Desulfomicrobium escambiense]|nr:hypothetical protein [Desulfomicrobium escambiense]
MDRLGPEPRSCPSRSSTSSPIRAPTPSPGKDPADRAADPEPALERRGQGPATPMRTGPIRASRAWASTACRSGPSATTSGASSKPASKRTSAA